MNPLDMLVHLLNFMAPALFLALLLPLGARLVVRKGGAPTRWLVQVGANFAVGVLVLALGLWFFGTDGKMATYAVLVLACASSQWILSRGWR